MPVFAAPSRWVVIQRNPRSGAGFSRQLLGDLVRGLKLRGLGVRMFGCRERLAAWMNAAENRKRLAGIVAAGGDGTVADCFNRYPGIPLAILPMGTENLLARALQIPFSGEAVARFIAEDRRVTLDLGLIGERRFALMASAGIDAEIVQRVHAARSGNISHATYIQPIVETLRTYDYPPLRVGIDDRPDVHMACLVEVVNVPIYALGLPLARSARADDGRFDLRMFGRGSAFQMLWYLCNVALGTHERLPDVASISARRVRIDSDRPVALQADGDPAGYTPAEITILPGALQVFAPSFAEV